MAWKMERKDAVDWFCGAIEGGVAYWMNEICTDVSIERNEAFGDDARLDDWEYTQVQFTDEDGKAHKITLEDMVERSTEYLQFLIEQIPFRVQNFVAGENSDADAEDYDRYFQWLAFGEVVYG